MKPWKEIWWKDLTLHQKDALVADKVLGYEWYKWVPNGKITAFKEPPEDSRQYFKDLGDEDWENKYYEPSITYHPVKEDVTCPSVFVRGREFEIVEAMEPLEFHLGKNRYGWIAEFSRIWRGKRKVIGRHSADTALDAIAVAAIRARGFEI